MSDWRTSKRVEVSTDVMGSFKGVALLADVPLQAAELALAAEHSSGPDDVSVLLSDDAKLRALNRQFNGEDSVTDVLSFNEVDGWHNGTPPPEATESHGFGAPGEQPRLGEIVISLEQTKRQALERSVTFERELAMLTIHGVLHLLGYDHADPEEERVMFGKTDAILATMFGE